MRDRLRRLTTKIGRKYSTLFIIFLSTDPPKRVNIKNEAEATSYYPPLFLTFSI